MIGYFRQQGEDFTLEYDGDKTFHIINNHTKESISVKDVFDIENFVFDIRYTQRFNHQNECEHKKEVRQ